MAWNNNYKKSIKDKVGQQKKNKVASTKQFCKKLQGADDIYLTKTKIAVRKIKSNKNGRICSDKTKYFPKTKENLSCAGKMFGHLRNGRY